MMVSRVVKPRPGQNFALRLVEKRLLARNLVTTNSRNVNGVTSTCSSRRNHGYSIQAIPKASYSSLDSSRFGDGSPSPTSSGFSLKQQRRSMSIANNLWNMFGSSNTIAIAETLLNEGSASSSASSSANKNAEKEQLFINFKDIQYGHLVPAASEIQARYESDLKALEKTIGQNDTSLAYDDIVPELERISRPLMTLQNIIELYSSVKKDPSFFEGLHEANEILQLSHERSNIIRDALLHIRSELEDGGEERRSVDHILRMQFLNGTYSPLGGNGGDDDNQLLIQQQIQATQKRLTNTYQKFIAKSSLTMEEHGKAASPQDLLQIMYEILALQNHFAKLLGFGSYASYSLVRHNAILSDVDEIISLHKDFGEDVGSIEKFSSDEFQSAYLDLAGRGSAIVDEKNYFELTSVLSGLFALCNDLFGITIEEEKGNVKGWNRDVRLFHVYDESTSENDNDEDTIVKKHVASFYLDPFRRLHKDLGCFVMPIQYARDGVSVPVVALSMDMRPPTWDDSPLQMDVQGVVNLFHEFGHALQNMLCDVNLGAYSGAHHIEMDAEETISQFMEYWLFEGGMLQKLAKHHENDDPLPKEAIDYIRQQRRAAKATDLLHRLFLGHLEVEVNANFDPNGEESIIAIQRKCAEKYCPHHMPPKGNIDPLIQIFRSSAYGKCTMQYRYLLSEIMSADAFDAFVNDDGELLKMVDLKERGMAFRKCFLSVGSSQSTTKAFEKFRGRNVQSAALLSHYGLV